MVGRSGGCRCGENLYSDRSLWRGDALAVGEGVSPTLRDSKIREKILYDFFETPTRHIYIIYSDSGWSFYISLTLAASRSELPRVDGRLVSHTFSCIIQPTPPTA